MVEDNGFYFSKIKIESIQKVNQQAIKLNICIPHYEEQAFKDRQFSLNFEEKTDQKAFITPIIFVKGSIKMKGSDFHRIEEMQMKLNPKEKEEMADIFKGDENEEIKEGQFRDTVKIVN